MLNTFFDLIWIGFFLGVGLTLAPTLIALITLVLSVLVYGIYFFLGGLFFLIRELFRK